MEKTNNNKTCIKCKSDFVYFPNETWWDYSCFTTVKLARCPECGCVQAIKYEEPHDVNNDTRYYKYKSPRAIKKICNT